MIYMCVTKSVKPSLFDRKVGIRKQPPSQFQKLANCLFCIRVLSKNQNTLLSYLSIKKKPFRLRTLKGHLKPQVLLELPLLVSDVRSLQETDCHPRRAKREPYKYVESFPT